MPLRKAVPLAYEVWNSLPEGKQKDALESVIYQSVKQIQYQERMKATGRGKRYYEANKAKILEKQKKRTLSHMQNDSTGV